jgi:serine/threonine-protein kinase
LGRKAEAVREGRKAVELLPPAQDTYFGMNNVISLAAAYAAVSEPDAASDQLKAALAVPSRVSVEMLRVDLDSNPLRAKPRSRQPLRAGCPRRG